MGSSNTKEESDDSNNSTNPIRASQNDESANHAEVRTFLLGLWPQVRDFRDAWASVPDQAHGLLKAIIFNKELIFDTELAVQFPDPKTGKVLFEVTPELYQKLAQVRDNLLGPYFSHDIQKRLANPGPVTTEFFRIFSTKDIGEEQYINMINVKIVPIWKFRPAPETNQMPNGDQREECVVATFMSEQPAPNRRLTSEPLRPSAEGEGAVTAVLTAGTPQRPDFVLWGCLFALLLMIGYVLRRRFMAPRKHSRRQTREPEARTADFIPV